jgi:hypothetical protein
VLVIGDGGNVASSARAARFLAGVEGTAKVFPDGGSSSSFGDVLSTLVLPRGGRSAKGEGCGGCGEVVQQLEEEWEEKVHLALRAEVFPQILLAANSVRFPKIVI